MKKGKRVVQTNHRKLLMTLLSVLLALGIVTPTNIHALEIDDQYTSIFEIETQAYMPEEETTQEENQETILNEENNTEEVQQENTEQVNETVVEEEEVVEEELPIINKEETTTEEVVEPTEEPLLTETLEVIEEEEASEEVVERIKLGKTRILKAPPSGSIVTVNTWADLKALGTEDNGVWVISNNYTIKLGNDLVACTPIKITGDVNITSDTPHTIYREKGNANFTVFTVENNGKLTLGDKVTMSGKIAETYGSKYKITVTDGYGTPIYETTVYDDETRTPLQILEDAGLSDESDTGKSNIYNLIGEKTSIDPDSPYSLGYKLKTDKPLDMAGMRNTQMKEVKGDLLIAAQWNDPDKNKKMYVVDGYGNEIYSVEVLANSTKTPRDLLTEARINDRDNPNNIATVLQQKLSNVDGPYKLGYTFDGWNVNNEGMDPFYSFSGDFYVVAKWIGVYKITITDGYERVLDTIAVPANSTQTPKDILEEKGYYTREDAESLIRSKTASDPTSPYSLGYLLLGNNAHWDMAGMRNTQMKDVGGDLLITAKWVVPEKDLNLRVTDGAGNTIFTSTDKSKPIQKLMAENGLNANAADQSATEKTAIATKVGSSAESPANDNNYSFNSWDFGGVVKSQTLTQIDGNVVVCAAWNPPGEVEYVWEVPNPIEEGMEIEIGIGGKFMGVNANGNTQWANNYNSNDEKWVIANVQDNTFEIVNKAHPTEKLWVKQSANNGYTAQSEGGFKYSTGADANPAQAFTRFSFVTINNESYLACVGEFQDYQGQYPTKTVYMVGNPGNQAIFFSDNAGLGAAVHVGKPTKKYDNPDTPGKTDVPGPGTPGGSEQVASVTEAVAPTDKDTNDAPGTQGHNLSTGSVPQTTKTKESGKVTPVTGLTSSDMPIKSDSIQDARYTLGGANETQIFDKEGKGFFVQVNNGGTLNIEGANLQDLKTGRLDNQGVMVQDTSVKNSAPVVVDGGTMHFTSGSIKNNWVGYIANDACSGMQVQGRNADSNIAGCNYNGVEDYIKRTNMTNTAGGVIFTNGAVGEITGTASIDNNRGDAGGIIVKGVKTDVTIGGGLVANTSETLASEPEKDPYFVKGTDGNYYKQTKTTPAVFPAGVSRDGSTMYDSMISSSVGGGHIDKNVGFHHAGAALVEDGATLRMVAEDSTMNNNVTWAKGGAVWATEFGTAGYAKIDYRNKKLVNTDVKNSREEGIFIMTNGTIDNNTAFVRGGGINVESNHVYLVKGTISNNNSRALGGGIYVEGDFPDYTYTLVVNKGYVGHNYAVRYWELDNFTPTENDVHTTSTGTWDDLTLSELNDRLDRKLGSTNNELITNPKISDNSTTLMPNHESALNDTNLAKGSGYPNRTADTLAYPRPHEGNGGGIWLCPIGGTAVFHMNAENEVIIDDNYASGRFTGDKTKGTDLYLHSGTGHMLVQNETTPGQYLEQWYNEKTDKLIPENGPVYSGPLYLENRTPDNAVYTDQEGAITYGQRKAKEEHDGVHIVDNISRDGGGIAANGTLLFGLPNDVYRHEAKMDFSKIWPAENNQTYPVNFKMFYLDENNELVELPDYAFSMDQSNTDSSSYDYNPQQQAGTTETNGEIIWKSNLTIPITIDKVVNGENVSIPMYKLKYKGPAFTYSITDSATESSITVNSGDVLDPSKVTDLRKLYAISHEKPNEQLEIVDWKLVVKEYTESGQEIGTAEFLNISGRSVTVSNDTSIPIDVIDAGGVGKKIKGYNINFSSVTFASEVKNGNGPTVEKYINNKVHENLSMFDQTFEYSIMAYVPLDATEVVIEDTLQAPLMFVDEKVNVPGNAYVAAHIKEPYGQFLLDGNEYQVVTNGLDYWLVASENEYYQIYNPEKNSNGELTYFSSISETAETKRSNTSLFATYKKGISTYKSSGIVDNSSLNGYGLVIEPENNHKGNGTTGTVVNHTDNTYFAAHPEQHLNGPINNNTVVIGRYDGDTFVPDATGNTIRVTVTDEMLKGTASGSSANQIDAHGKWIVLTYTAAIKPEYHDVEVLRKATNGWITDEESKKGSPNFISDLEEKAGVTVQSVYQNASKGLYYARGVDANGNTNDYIYVSVSPEKMRNMDNHIQPNGTTNRGELKDEYLAQEWYKIYQRTGSDGSRYTAYESVSYQDENHNDINLYHASYNHSQELETNSSTRVEFEGDVARVSIKNILDGTSSAINGHSVTKIDSYNYPVIDAKEPHSGVKNQASYTVTFPLGGKSKHKTNIVTIDVFQPEKYVNDKVHEVLRHDSSTKGSFDQPFEYEIMVFVPDDAQEIMIYDTLRDDLMFVDRHGKTQYKTYTIGTAENKNYSDLRDIPNSDFMVQRAGDTTVGQSMVSNTSVHYTGSGWALISDFAEAERENIVAAAQGPTRFFIQTKNPTKYYFREKASGSQWTEATDSTNPNQSFVQGRIEIAQNGTDATITELDLATTESATSKNMLETVDSNNHKGDGTGTVSENAGTALNEPIATAGYIMLGDAPSNPNNVTMPTTNKKDGNTIYLKIDESTGIEQARGKWVKLSFNAQIKPSKYANIVHKINKRSRHTTDSSQAVDPNNPAGYIYRLSMHTPDKMNAVGYDIDRDSVPSNQIVGHYQKDSNGNFTVFYQITNPAGKEGTDFIYAYNAEKTYYAETYDALPDSVKTATGINNNLVQAVYLRKGWDDVQDGNNDGLDDTVKSWEKVTDDGYVIDGEKLYNENGIYKYIDVQKDGSHAGLGNHANYAIKLDNQWHYSTTNTVTVVPLLRTLTFNKLWIVEKDKTIPNEDVNAKVLRDSLKLFWERIDNVIPTSADHGKTVGEITDLYKNNITITSEKVEEHGENTRYTWKIEITDLPQLRPSMKYYVEESLIPGFEWAEYTNPEDPEAKEHAHDKGTIINSEEDRPDETRLLVTKKWDVGSKEERDKVVNEEIQVQLMTIFNGKQQPIYQRDSSNKVVFEEKANGTYLLGNDGNYYLTTDTLPSGVSDANPSKRYSPKVDSESIQTLNTGNNWLYDFRSLPRFARDVNGNPLYIKAGKTLEEYHAAIEGGTLTDAEITAEYLTTDATLAASDNGTFVYADYTYTVELLSDPEGYILSTKGKQTKNYHEGMTSELSEAYDVETYTYEEGTTPAGRKVGTWKRAEVVAVEKITLEYVNDGIGNTTLVETDRRFLEGSELEQKLAQLNATDRAQFEEDCKNGAKSPGLPETGGSTDPKYIYDYGCYYRTLEEYETYEVDVINTKPQIEKYINKDVHLETFFGNEFVYDIMVYVPDEATEIEITDELLPTLTLKSFLEPIISGPVNRLVTGYKEYKVDQLPETLEVVVHAENNHTINGTVDTMKANPTQNTVSGSAKGTLTVDGNNFKIKLTDIVHYGASFVPYEYGEYVKVADMEGKDIKHVKENEIPSGYARRDDERYRAVGSAYYIVDASGTYVRVADENGANIHFVAQGQIPSGYTRVDENLYKQVDSKDQRIGGRYVQVTFKAGFNQQVVDTDAFIDFLNSNASKPNSSNKENWDKYDWDVIKVTDNKAWDEYIESLGYQKNTHQYVPAANTVPEPIAELKMQIGTSNISKAIKNGDKYYAAKVGNDYYVYPMNLTTDSQYNNQWLKVLGNPIRYFTLDNLETPVKSGSTLDGISDYWYAGNNSYIKPTIDNGTNLITNNTTFVPVVEGETYYKEVVEGQQDKYYLDWEVDEYAGDKKETIIANGTYKKIDWARGDGDVIRNNSSPYIGPHAGIVNTASYEVTYGNKYKSTHKSNTVTVVPQVYKLPHSGGIGTYWHTIAGTGLLVLGMYYGLMELKRRKRRKAS